MSIDAVHARTRVRINAAVDVTEQGIDQSLQRTLTGVHPHIAHFAQQFPAEDGMTWLHAGGHLGKFDATVRSALHAFTQSAWEAIHSGITTASVSGIDAAQAMLAAGLPPHIAAWQLRSVQVRSAVKANMERSQKLLGTFDAQTRDRMRTLLYSAIDRGVNPLVLARDLENILGMERNRAITIARTEMLGAYRDANLANFRANSDVCDGWVWSAAIGACGFCSFANGSEHDLSEDMSSHTRCRCSPKPKTRSYSDILGAFGIEF